MENQQDQLNNIFFIGGEIQLKYGNENMFIDFYKMYIFYKLKYIIINESGGKINLV